VNYEKPICLTTSAASFNSVAVRLELPRIVPSGPRINAEAITTSSISVKPTILRSPAERSLSLTAAQGGIQIASLLLGPMPNILAPSHPSVVPAISHPAILNPPAVINTPKLTPSVAPSRPAGAVTEKVLKDQAPAKPSNTAATKTTKKRRAKAVVTAVACSKLDNDDEVKYVALTFDDGPSPVYTPKVLAILKKEGIHATFCLIGRHAKKYPEIVQQIVAEGHQIADHTMNHDEYLQRRSAKKIKEEILGTKTLLESIVPGTPIAFYRAPAGNIDHRIREMVTDWGMTPLGWSVDTKDWQKPGVDEILANVKSELRPGGIILMHDAGGDRSDTLEALEKVIPQLKKDGYQFVFPG
jgi:peptidoglycan-N-acetylglucosamine deacetylase